MDDGYAVFPGLDVGKGEHHAVGLDPAGRRLHGGPLPNSEPKLREVFDKLAKLGRVLVVVDQHNTIGALPVTVARACGLDVAYLPGLATRGIADLYPGNAKTDARDAFVIADAARTLPHALRRIDVGDDTLAELDVLIGFDDDLAAEATRISNRIRGLLTGLHPALERVLGPRAAHPATLEILSRPAARSAARVLTSMPGIGVRTAARILLEVGDASAFKSSAHLAAYAGIAPVTRTSGTSIKGEHPARSGNRKLKRAFFLSAFAALHDPAGRTYYDRQRAEGKKHNAALIRLARRRRDVLFAMLRNSAHYRHTEPAHTAIAA
ncbi:IS110 family transposase [Actinokineospora auranticolor]|uniref:Transposase n=1 Tax=Actinokineospora auranticolor TaxID=155976 RepID=A0A2S6GJ58_9PSEU|nr:transposase [Actinokineospora auranticolor]PPK65191.1 transposase [Actinokineospora auranticolor]